MDPIITLAQAKTWIGITGTADDEIIQDIIDAVQELVLEACDCEFELTPVEKFITDGVRSDVIVVDHWPLVSVQRLDFGCDSSGENGTTLDPEQYDVTESGIVLRHVSSPWGHGLVRVDYTHGFDGVPKKVMLATKMGVEAFYRRNKRKTIDISSRSKEGESESYGAAWDKKTGLPASILGILSDYRSIEFPLLPMATRNQ